MRIIYKVLIYIFFFNYCCNLSYAGFGFGGANLPVPDAASCSDTFHYESPCYRHSYGYEKQATCTDREEEKGPCCCGLEVEMSCSNLPAYESSTGPIERCTPIFPDKEEECNNGGGIVILYSPFLLLDDPEHLCCCYKKLLNDPSKAVSN